MFTIFSELLNIAISCPFHPLCCYEKQNNNWKRKKRKRKNKNQNKRRKRKKNKEEEEEEGREEKEEKKDMERRSQDGFKGKFASSHTKWLGEWQEQTLNLGKVGELVIWWIDFQWWWIELREVFRDEETRLFCRDEPEGWSVPNAVRSTHTGPNGTAGCGDKEVIRDLDHKQ